MKLSCKRTGMWYGILIAFSLITFNNVAAETKYEVRIKAIKYLAVHKNWLVVPTEVDLRLEWEILSRDSNDPTGMVETLSPEALPFTYQVYIYEGDTSTEPTMREVRKIDYSDFSGKRVGKTYLFKVRAYSPNSMLIAESAPATILVGRDNDAQFESLAGHNWTYNLHPGRWQLWLAGKPDTYDKSTRLGKAAFLFLSISSAFSFFILIFYSTRTLYLGNIFPFKRSKKNLFWSLSLSCDNSYENRLTNKFKFILRAWETIAANSRQVADSAVRNIPAGLSSTEKMASVDVACMEYWTSDGDRAIGTIEDIIAFPDESKLNGKGNPDDLLTELVIKIEDSFHDLIAKNGHEVTNGGPDLGDMQKLIDEIYEPVLNDDKPLARIRKWLLRKGVFDLRKGLRPFPTSKIINSGLEIHRMNGFRWLKPAEEVKRAFENRASMEIESLRRKSRIEWFWNYAALAPLVGLFGTVTGITYAFEQLAQNKITVNPGAALQGLSSGIFEALWTTIFGLANGIIFLLIYYYFKHKLDWIYAKWEEIYVTITEKV